MTVISFLYCPPQPSIRTLSIIIMTRPTGEESGLSLLVQGLNGPLQRTTYPVLLKHLLFNNLRDIIKVLSQFHKTDEDLSDECPLTAVYIPLINKDVTQHSMTRMKMTLLLLNLSSTIGQTLFQ